MKNIPCEQNPALQLTDRVQQQRLHRVIREELTQIEREVLLGYYFQDLKISQIAKNRGVHKSSVYRALHRAEGKLRRFLRY